MTRAVHHLLAAAVVLAAAGGAAASFYSVVDIGTLGGTFSAAHGLSEGGDVVGEAAIPTGDTHAFLYRAGTLSDLGTLPGGRSSVALGVNASGQVVGYGDVAGSTRHAFLADGGPPVDLGTLPGGTYSLARAINADGVIVGESDVLVYLRSQVHAFRWAAGAFDDIGGVLLSSTSTATAIDDSGNVAGWARVPRSQLHEAFRLSASDKAHDLGTLGAASSEAYGMNDAGEVVGALRTGTGSTATTQAVLFASRGRTPGVLPGLGGAQAMAVDANASGQIVGSATGPDGLSHAVLWDGGGITKLDDMIDAGSGMTLTAAEAINDAGLIVGSGVTHGQTHAVLLIPSAGPTSESTTTTTVLATTTTVPAPVPCEVLRQRDAATCLLERLAGELSAAGSADIRDRARMRLERPVDRALHRLAVSGRPRDLRRAQQQVTAFLRLLHQTRLGIELADRLRSLALGVRERLRPITP
jgi:probable HAF family extracellular repeat protein